MICYNRPNSPNRPLTLQTIERAGQVFTVARSNLIKNTNDVFKIRIFDLLKVDRFINANDVIKKSLVMSLFDPTFINNELIETFCVDDKYQMVELLTYSKVDSSTNDNIRLVEKLLKDQRIDPCVNDCYLIKVALKNYDIIKLLLRDKRIYTNKRFSGLYTVIKYVNYFKVDNKIVIKDVMNTIISFMTKLTLDFQQPD
jgi:hypothetical protein